MERRDWLNLALVVVVSIVSFFMGYELRFRVIRSNAANLVLHGNDTHVVVRNGQTFEHVIIIGTGNEVTSCETERQR